MKNRVAREAKFQDGLEIFKRISVYLLINSTTLSMNSFSPVVITSRFG